jgi:glycosyltransferase involved in cell wall biosynthesis
MNSSPRLSVIVCVYNMAREAPRTILSAACPYQRGVGIGDYEVIVVDNGSSPPFLETYKTDLPAGVTIHSMPNPHPSPVFALNWAARELARGDILLFAIDGARIFSNGLYAATLDVYSVIKEAFVYTLQWHLGPKIQRISVAEGYNQQVEDRLLEESGWPEVPRALFDISVLAGSSQRGHFKPVRESNAFAMTRAAFESVGGFDERFVSPGGGFANLEIFSRYVGRPRSTNVCLLSEGTFHQVHGGITTSESFDESRGLFNEEYQAIFGEECCSPSYDFLLYCSGDMEFLKFTKAYTKWMQKAQKDALTS